MNRCNFELPHDLIYELIVYLSPTTMKNLKMTNRYYNQIDLTEKYLWIKKYQYDNIIFNSSMLYNMQEYQSIINLKQLIEFKDLNFIFFNKPWVIYDIRLKFEDFKEAIDGIIVDEHVKIYLSIGKYLQITIKLVGNNAIMWIDDEMEQHDVLKLAYLYCEDMIIN